MAQCDLWSLQTLSDNTQISWDKCMTNKNYKEPNSIAQEIYDELDETQDGEVLPLPLLPPFPSQPPLIPESTLPPKSFVSHTLPGDSLTCAHEMSLLQVTPKEYCAVARKHTARLTDEQCKEIIKLMDEGLLSESLKRHSAPL